MNPVLEFTDCPAGPGASPEPQRPECVRVCLDAFDLEPDGDVDLADFAVFQGVFQGL